MSGFGGIGWVCTTFGTTTLSPGLSVAEKVGGVTPGAAAATPRPAASASSAAVKIPSAMRRGVLRLISLPLLLARHGRRRVR